VWLSIFLLIVYFHYSDLGSFPARPHTWAQSDQYALTLGFKRNGLNFFRPETYVLNKQFPHGFLRPDTTSVTAVDFPIHNFIPAAFMRLFHSDHPAWFRLYSFLLGLLGLWYLFKLAYLLTENPRKAAIVFGISATVPVLILFQVSFLPSPQSLTFVLMGMYYYFTYLKHGEKISFFLSIFLLTLAALTRKTLLGVLLCIWLYEIAGNIFKKRSIQFQHTVILAFLALFIGYQLHYQQLYNRHGSMFLSYFLMPQNWEEAKRLLKVIFTKWPATFGSAVHYLALGGALIVVLYRLPDILRSNDRIARAASFFTACMFLGYAFFFVIMMKQWEHHDYYLLDTFFLPSFLLLSLGIRFFPSRWVTPSNRFVWAALIVLALMYATSHAHQVRTERMRMESHNDPYRIHLYYQNSAQLLDSMGVPSDARILVLDAYAPNLPFIHMRRKGYAVLTTSPKHLRTALGWDYDLVSIPDSTIITDLYTNLPSISHYLEPFATNGKVSFYRVRRAKGPSTLLDLLGIDSAQVILHDSIAFDTHLVRPSTAWEYRRIVQDSFDHSNYHMALYIGEGFGLKWEIPCPKGWSDRPLRMLITARVKAYEPGTLYLVATCGNPSAGKLTYRQANINQQLYPYRQWRTVAALLTLDPPPPNEHCFLRVYFWNYDKRQVFFDDMKITAYLAKDSTSFFR